MPELPEVESARSVIERAALDRVIAEVDDSDAYVCRPHRPGDIRAALLGRRLAAAHRRGKTMWCDTGGGPVLGIHLGMSGKIVIADLDHVGWIRDERRCDGLLGGENSDQEFFNLGPHVRQPFSL